MSTRFPSRRQLSPSAYPKSFRRNVYKKQGGASQATANFGAACLLDRPTAYLPGKAGMAQATLDRQAVRNEDIRQPELALQLLQQQQNLRAHGNVQRRNRLVGDDKLRPQNQRPRTISNKYFSSVLYTRLVFTSLQTTSSPYKESQLLYKVQSLPAQRVVRVSIDDPIRSFVGLAFVGLWLFLFIESVKDMKTNPVSVVFWMVVLVFFVSMGLRGLRKGLANRRLLENGGCVIGGVRSQIEVKVGRGQRASEITYSFKDTLGQTWFGEGTDHTKSYFPEMALMIFYDLKDPSQNVAAFATAWKTLGPDKELVDLD